MPKSSQGFVTSPAVMKMMTHTPGNLMNITLPKDNGDGKPQMHPVFLIFYTFIPVSAGSNYASFSDILATAVKAVIFLDCPKAIRSERS